MHNIGDDLGHCLQIVRSQSGMDEEGQTRICKFAGNSEPFWRTGRGKRLFEVNLTPSAARTWDSTRRDPLEDAVAVPIWFQHFWPDERAAAVERMINMIRWNRNAECRQLGKVCRHDRGIEPTLLQPCGDFQKLAASDRSLHFSHA